MYRGLRMSVVGLGYDRTPMMTALTRVIQQAKAA